MKLGLNEQKPSKGCKKAKQNSTNSTNKTSLKREKYTQSRSFYLARSIFQSIFREIFIENWGRLDSNQRRPKSRDLQSLAIATMRHPQKGYAGERNRTLNPLITSQVLYRLSYTSEKDTELITKKLFCSQLLSSVVLFSSGGFSCFSGGFSSLETRVLS